MQIVERVKKERETAQSRVKYFFENIIVSGSNKYINCRISSTAWEWNSLGIWRKNYWIA